MAPSRTSMPRDGALRSARTTGFRTVSNLLVDRGEDEFSPSTCGEDHRARGGMILPTSSALGRRPSKAIGTLFVYQSAMDGSEDGDSRCGRPGPGLSIRIAHRCAHVGARPCESSVRGEFGRVGSFCAGLSMANPPSFPWQLTRDRPNATGCPKLGPT